MKKQQWFLPLILLLLTATTQGSWAQNPTAPTPTAPTYEMALVWIADADSHEYIFTINNAVGFKSVAALKHFVGNMEAGSNLRWAPSCKRMGDEPLLSSPQDMQDFKDFCAQHHVVFTLVPSG